jgi:hypothetical protein
MSDPMLRSRVHGYSTSPRLGRFMGEIELAGGKSSKGVWAEDFFRQSSLPTASLFSVKKTC